MEPVNKGACDLLKLSPSFIPDSRINSWSLCSHSPLPGVLTPDHCTAWWLQPDPSQMSTGTSLPPPHLWSFIGPHWLSLAQFSPLCLSWYYTPFVGWYSLTPEFIRHWIPSSWHSEQMNKSMNEHTDSWITVKYRTIWELEEIPCIAPGLTWLCIWMRPQLCATPKSCQLVTTSPPQAEPLSSMNGYPGCLTPGHERAPSGPIAAAGRLDDGHVFKAKAAAFCPGWKPSVHSAHAESAELCYLLQGNGRAVSPHRLWRRLQVGSGNHPQQAPAPREAGTPPGSWEYIAAPLPEKLQIPGEGWLSPCHRKVKSIVNWSLVRKDLSEPYFFKKQ